MNAQQKKTSQWLPGQRTTGKERKEKLRMNTREFGGVINTFSIFTVMIVSWYTRLCLC